MMIHELMIPTDNQLLNYFFYKKILINKILKAFNNALMQQYDSISHSVKFIGSRSYLTAIMLTQNQTLIYEMESPER